MQNARRPALWTLLLLAVVAVTGCTRLGGTVTVNPDDTAYVDMVLSVPDDAAHAEAKKQIAEACEPVMAPKPEPYAAGGRTGCRVKGQLSPTKLVNLGMVIQTEGDVQRFRWQVGNPLERGRPSQGAVGDRISEMDVRVTFRGKVRTHSGSSTVEGRTVVWHNSADLAKPLEAEAAKPGLLDRTPGEWALIALVLLAIVGYVVWVIRDTVRRRRLQHQQPWGGPQFGPPGARPPAG